MGRLLLFLFGLSSVIWGLASLFMRTAVTSFQNANLDNGDAIIEFLAINAGLWPAVGVLCLVGATLKRMRIPALVTLIVCLSGMVAGRVLGLVQGEEAGFYTYAALGFESTMVILGSIAFGVEKANQATEAGNANES